MTVTKPAPTRLGRPAEGLARYYLDCGWWRHPSFDDLSAEALAVWQAAVSYSNEHTTDGRLPANIETLSLKLGLRVSWVRKARRELLAAGRWDEADGGLVIVGFLDHNPSKAEVQEWTQERSQRGTLGNHRRWHEARGVTDPECVHCRQPDPVPTSPKDRNSDRRSDPNGESVGYPPGIAWDGMGENINKSSDNSHKGPAPPDDDEPHQPAPEPVADGTGRPALDPEALVGATLAVLAERDLAVRQRQTHLEPIGNIRNWTARAQDQRRELMGDLIGQFAASHPTATPAELAELVEPFRATDRTPAGDRIDHRYDAQQQAQRAAQTEHMQAVRQLATEPPDPARNVAAIHAIRQQHPLATAPPSDP